MKTENKKYQQKSDKNHRAINIQVKHNQHQLLSITQFTVKSFKSFMGQAATQMVSSFLTLLNHSTNYRSYSQASTKYFDSSTLFSIPLTYFELKTIRTYRKNKITNFYLSNGTKLRTRRD